MPLRAVATRGACKTKHVGAQDGAGYLYGMDILTAMHHDELFGPWFRGASWRAWEAYLAALFGLPMSDEQLATYKECTGRTTAPTEPFSEAWLVCGRRAGKSRILALIAVYLSCFRRWTDHLAPGERGTVMIIAADRRQARTIKRYIMGMLENVPILKDELIRETGDEIELRNSITIEIGTRSFRSVRGYTVIAALCDEIAFWRSDESANPDREVLDALRPAMGTVPGSMLLCASSPYARKGAMYESWRRWHGKDEAPALIWHASSRAMNPTLPQRVVDEAMERDPAAASAEYLAHWRSDVESFVSQEVVDAAICPGRHELPRISGAQYVAFVDPSGGSSDSMTLAICHSEGERAILDATREIKPPFSPESAVADFAALMKSYGISSVTGDRYGGEWPREQFRKAGIEYQLSDKAKSDLYRDLLPMLNSGRAELLDIPRIALQLVALERRTARGGRDSIDHPPGGHDDLANAVAGALLMASKPSGYDTSLEWVGSWAQMETNNVMFGDR